jgi:TatD DNase family protein
MFEMLGETRYIGEVGLDFITKDQRDRTLQTRVFSSILERCASSKDKVFTIHSRHAAAEVVSLVGEGYPGTMILHWFSGTLKVLDKAVSHGFYFSINPSMLATIKGVQLIAAMPRDRILTESDGPFTTTDGRPTRPRDVEHVISGLAGLWKTDKREVAEKLYTNFCTALDGPQGITSKKSHL